MHKLFSIVIPLYNKRQYVRRAIDSVLGQTFTDFELIVIDDGSTDGSHEVLADIKDTRFQLVRQDNAGEGPARNCGFAKATGTWVALLDADDMWLSCHLNELIKVANFAPDAGLISTSAVEVSEGSAPTDAYSQRDAHIGKVDYFARATANIGFINASTVAVRRNVFAAVGGFGPFKAGADLEYWARVAVDFPVAVSSRITSIYFRGTGGVMEQIAAGQAHKPRPVNRLEDLSPSVAFLCRRAETHPSQWHDASIRTYVNSRIWNGVKGSLFHRRIDCARALGRLFLPPASTKARLLRLALTLPEPVIHTHLSLYQLFQAGFRRLGPLRWRHRPIP